MGPPLWSSTCQGILTLDLSRDLRFCEDRKDCVLRRLGLQSGMTVVDLGCGPGALTRKLARWLGPTSSVIGIDRDTAFLAYARRKGQAQGLPHLRFWAGDVLALPLAAQSVEACTSHTVIEHVPNRAFLQEQHRVCRPGGPVSVMISLGDKAIISKPPEVPPRSAREQELWMPLQRAFEAGNAQHIGRTYWVGVDGLPRVFHEVGFTEVQVDALTLPVVVDDARHSQAEQRAMVEAERQVTLEWLEMGRHLVSEALSPAQVEELRRLIEQRYAERLRLVEQQSALWDYQIYVVLVVRGTV